MSDDKVTTPIPDWRNADPETLEPHFCNWMIALTSEGLHDKGDIAIVLAMQSAALQAAQAQLAQVERERDGAVALIDQIPKGPNEWCDECGGDNEECPASCVHRLVAEFCSAQKEQEGRG